MKRINFRDGGKADTETALRPDREQADTGTSKNPAVGVFRQPDQRVEPVGEERRYKVDQQQREREHARQQ